MADAVIEKPREEEVVVVVVEKPKEVKLSWGDIVDDEETTAASSSTSEDKSLTPDMEALKIEEDKPTHKFLDDPEDSNIKAIAERRKSNVVIAEDVEAVTKLFLGFSLWCVGYGIVYTVGIIIVLDVNKVSVIVSMIPALLGSCLLLRWAHAYAVKLIDSYLINPGPSQLIPENRRREFEKNITLRFICPLLCFSVDTMIIRVNFDWIQHHAKPPQPSTTVRHIFVLSLGLVSLLLAHLNWIRVYLNKKLIIMRGLPNHHPKEETTYQQQQQY